MGVRHAELCKYTMPMCTCYCRPHANVNDTIIHGLLKIRQCVSLLATVRLTHLQHKLVGNKLHKIITEPSPYYEQICCFLTKGENAFADIYI